MTATTQEQTGEVSKAYDRVIKQGIAAIETGWEQTTVAAKLFATASQTEMDSASKTWEGAINDATSHNEKLTELLKEAATFPPFDAAGLKPETKELVNHLFEEAKSFSQSWTGYFAGLEKRQADFIHGMSETSSKFIELSQDLAKSAVAYGEAVLEWSQDAGKSESTENEN